MCISLLHLHAATSHGAGLHPHLTAVNHIHRRAAHPQAAKAYDQAVLKLRGRDNTGKRFGVDIGVQPLNNNDVRPLAPYSESICLSQPGGPSGGGFAADVA